MIEFETVRQEVSECIVEFQNGCVYNMTKLKRYNEVPILGSKRKYKISLSSATFPSDMIDDCQMSKVRTIIVKTPERDIDGGNISIIKTFRNVKVLDVDLNGIESDSEPDVLHFEFSGKLIK